MVPQCAGDKDSERDEKGQAGDDESTEPEAYEQGGMANQKSATAQETWRDQSDGQVDREKNACDEHVSCARGRV